MLKKCTPLVSTLSDGLPRVQWECPCSAQWQEKSHGMFTIVETDKMSDRCECDSLKHIPCRSPEPIWRRLNFTRSDYPLVHNLTPCHMHCVVPTSVYWNDVSGHKQLLGMEIVGRLLLIQVSFLGMHFIEVGHMNVIIYCMTSWLMDTRYSCRATRVHFLKLHCKCSSLKWTQ